ncbi:SSUH2 [Cordylochernes scorpioides]|uniref:SSUH2 n=1 Tax=Cordylochernes scorpioides TaxID=51811 RepID=A0ABY6K960_9ARAC|nr:SSUH2 [Cordylochernes scorpioides]
MPVHEPRPTAPQLDQLIAGYENVTYNPACLKPPAYTPPSAPAPPAPTSLSDFSNADCRIAPLAEEQAKEALEDFLAENCCYGKKPARQLVITSMTMTSCFLVGRLTFLVNG